MLEVEPAGRRGCKSHGTSTDYVTIQFRITILRLLAKILVHSRV